MRKDIEAVILFIIVVVVIGFIVYASSHGVNITGTNH